jgi:hypothetical protein
MNLFRLMVVCPVCGWAPALTAYGAQIEAARDLEPDTPLLQYKCQHRRCTTIFPVAADAFQRAERIPPKVPRRSAA